MSRQRTFAFLIRLLLAAGAWWTLTNGAYGWDSLVIGIPVAMIAAAVSTWLMPPFHWSLAGAARFAVHFTRESLRGGIDVARRAFHPRVPLDPGVFRYDFRLDGDLPRVMLANTSGLLPGSLVVDLDDDGMEVHVLDAGRDVIAEVAATEVRVGALLRAPPRAAGDVPPQGRQDT